MITNAILRWAKNRKPDFVIGGLDNPYLERHRLIPRNRVFNVYVHQFLRSDDDRALHGHPWAFNASILIQGQYVEHTIEAGGVHVATHRQQGDVKFRWGESPHRVELYRSVMAVGNGKPHFCGKPLLCWTIFITGPVVRKWGFHCPKGWVSWQKFTAPDDKGVVGRGCDQ